MHVTNVVFDDTHESQVPLVSMKVSYSNPEDTDDSEVSVHGRFGGLKLCYLPHIVPEIANYGAVALHEVTTTLKSLPLFAPVAASEGEPAAWISADGGVSTTVAEPTTDEETPPTQQVEQHLAAVARTQGGPSISLDIGFQAPFSVVLPSGTLCPNEAMVLIFDGLNAQLTREAVSVLGVFAMTMAARR